MKALFNVQRAAYCALVLAGVHIPAAIKIVGSSREMLGRHIGGDWFRMPKWADGRAPNVERQRAIVERHLSGHFSMEQTGKAFGITRERVRQILVKHNISARTYGVTDPAIVTAVLARYRTLIGEGLTSKKAAKLVGRDHSILSIWAEERGERLPPPIMRFESKWPAYVEFYQAHPEMNGRQVAFHFKTSPVEISRALDAAGITSRWFKSPEAAARRRAPRKKAAIPSELRGAA